MDRITQAHKSPNPSLISEMFVFQVQSGTPANQEIMTGPLRFIFGAEWRKTEFDVWPGGGRRGRRNGVRAHLSAKLNNTMATA